MNLKRSNKVIVKIVLGLFLFTQLLVPVPANAEALIDKKTFLADEFTQDIERYMERVRDKEADYDNPITKSDLNELEDYFDNIFYLLDLEIVRLVDQTFSTQERLEIENAFTEIDLQFQATLNNIEDKVDSDADEDMDDFKKNVLDKTLSYKASLEDVIELKSEGAEISKGTAMEKVSTTTQGLDEVIDKLKVITSNLKNLRTQMSGVTASSSTFNTYSDKAFDYIEDAENQVRTLDYVNIRDSSNLKAEVNNLNKESDRFLTDFESKFEASFELDTTDLKKTIEYGQKQLTTAFQDVISNRNIAELSITEVLEEIDNLEQRAHDSYEDIPEFDIGQIVEAMEDLKDDDEDEDTDDLLKSIDELKSKASVSSIYKDDFPGDTERRVDNLLEGFKRVRKGTYSTTIGSVLASMDTHIANVTTVKNALEANISAYEDLEDTEEDLESILDESRNSILELRLVGLTGGNQTDLDAKIDSLGTAISSTLDTIEDRISSSLDSYYDEMVFDLKGSDTVSTYSMMTRLYNTVDVVAASSGDGVTTTNNILSFIETKKMH